MSMNMKKILVLLFAMSIALIGMAGASYLTTSQSISLKNSTPDTLRLGNATADQTITLNAAAYNNAPRTFIVAVNPGTHYVILKAAAGDTVGGQVAIQSTDQGSSVMLIPDPANDNYQIVNQIGIWNVTQTLGDVAITNLDVSGEIDQLGDLGDLDTSETGTLVGAINETVANIEDNNTRTTDLETYLGTNATQIDTVQSWLGTNVSYLDANATKADNALSWLALNETRIDDTQSWLGSNASYLDANATKANNALSWLSLNATKADNSLSWLGLNATKANNALSWTALNATKADNALSWLALNDTKADNALSWLALNKTRIDTLEGYDLKLNLIAGGSAGNHTLTGVTTADALGGVIYATKTTGNITALTDLMAEFTGGGKGIIDTNVIANGGGTNTSGGYLLVAWMDKS